MMERKSNEEILKIVEEKIADRDLDVKETEEKLGEMLEERGVTDPEILEIFDEAGEAKFNKEPDNHYKGAE